MVYIILVNWNGWRDTIECLESVFRLSSPAFRVIVCDNDSEDGSLERIADWAGGRLEAGCSNPDLRHLSSPPCPKPIPLLQITPSDLPVSATRNEKLVLISTGANLGFAGGNNVGMRFALAAGDVEYVWLLNNDTVVDPAALTALIGTMVQEPRAGICGSTLLYYDRPGVVQAMGGSVYNLWTARGGHIGLGTRWHGSPSHESAEGRMNYVVGASMLVRRQFLVEIGFMNESYFLYFEEIDWALRARGRFSLAYAPQSIVYHKEGRSIGTSVFRTRRSPKSEYFAARSALLLTKQHSLLALPIVAFALLSRSVLRLVAGNVEAAAAIVRGLRDSI